MSKFLIIFLTENYAKPAKKAKPFTSVMLKTLLDYFFACDNSLKDDECIVIMISVMFFLMARHEEISKLTKDCVKILRVW